GDGRLLGIQKTGETHVQLLQPTGSVPIVEQLEYSRGVAQAGVASGRRRRVRNYPEPELQLLAAITRVAGFTVHASTSCSRPSNKSSSCSITAADGRSTCTPRPGASLPRKKNKSAPPTCCS